MLVQGRDLQLYGVTDIDKGIALAKAGDIDLADLMGPQPFLGQLLK